MTSAKNNPFIQATSKATKTKSKQERRDGRLPLPALTAVGFRLLTVVVANRHISFIVWQADHFHGTRLVTSLWVALAKT